MATPAGAGSTACAAVRVAHLQDLPAELALRALRQLALLVHEVWKHCTDEFACPAQAEQALQQRKDAPHEALFVALDPNDSLVGTFSVGHEDFYEGFSRSNGIEPGFVGRDLCTVESWRGVVVQGLKVCEMLLRESLLWVRRRGGRQLTLFTEPGPIDLRAMYGRLGAVILREGLQHRWLAEHSITMLGYPVRQTLNRLDALQQYRQAADHPPGFIKAPGFASSPSSWRTRYTPASRMSKARSTSQIAARAAIAPDPPTNTSRR